MKKNTKMSAGKAAKKKVFVVLGVLLIAAVMLSVVIAVTKIASPKAVFQKGICYTTWSNDAYASRESDESLQRIKVLGGDWVAILTTWYQDRAYSTEIHPTDRTPTDESIIHAIEKSHSLGMKVMIKPHLDIIDISDGSWRGDIASVTEEGWEAWFDSYKKFILHYAKIAREKGVEMLCIGTELTASSVTREADWRDVIASVRRVYKGAITYTANWHDEYIDIRFWDALDYAGVDAYFPLSNKDAPTLDELREGWVKWVREVEMWQKRIRKPVIFPEVGYHSADGAARTPWAHESPGNVNLKLQADCYNALLEAFWEKEWFYGAYWWKWGTSVKMGGVNNRDFTPQNKPAEAVIKDWYTGKSIPQKRYN